MATSLSSPPPRPTRGGPVWLFSLVSFSLGPDSRTARVAHGPAPARPVFVGDGVRLSPARVHPGSAGSPRPQGPLAPSLIGSYLWPSPPCLRRRGPAPLPLLGRDGWPPPSSSTEEPRLQAGEQVPFLSSPDQAAGAGGGANPWLAAPDPQPLPYGSKSDHGLPICSRSGRIPCPGTTNSLYSFHNLLQTATCFINKLN